MAETMNVVLGQYKGLKLKKETVQVSAEEIAAAIRNMQEQSLEKKPVERPVQNGDEVMIDYAGFCDGVQFDGGTAENQPLVIGSGHFIPGFEEQLIGAVKGEQRDVNLSFPEQYHAEHLAGKPAVFKVTVREIREQVLPELSDAWAQSCGFDSLAALNTAVEQGLKQRKEANANAALETGAIDRIIAASEMILPELMLSAAVDELMMAFEMQLGQQGYTLEQYCAGTGETKEMMAQRLRPAAEARVRTRAVLQAIAKKEGLEALPEDVDAKLAEMARQYGMPVEQLKTYISEEDMGYIVEDILSLKAITVVLENAVIEE